MTAKVIDDMSNAEYHSSDAISKSGLDKFNHSPLHYWREYLDPNKPPTVWTDAFTIGSLAHCLVLEPHKLDEDFIKQPDINRRTKAGKEEYEAFEKEAGGKIIYTEQMLNQCKKIANAVADHPLAGAYLDGFGKAETSIFWQWSEELPIECRCRPDFIREDGVIVDFKTALSASPYAFQRKAFDLRYHVQAAFYTQGYIAAYGEQPKGFIFVACEKAEPYCVSVFRSTEEWLAAGLIDAEDNLRRYYTCKRADVWPGYNDNAMCDLNVPGWALRNYELNGE